MSKKWYNYFVSVEGEGQPESAPPADAAQAIADIAAAVQPAIEQRVEQKVEKQAPTPGSPVKPMSFSEIYSTAEIASPPHGYTIMKVSEMLQSQHIKELPSEVKRSSVLVALEAAGVHMKDIVEDAVRRDKALDAFERVQQKHAEDFELAKLDENKKLQAELDRITAEHKAKMQANDEAVAARKEAFFAWRLDKQKEEQKIADAVSYFVTENPITTSRSPAKP
jgi:hypothetical protein